jgi:hypothetical protein
MIYQRKLIPGFSGYEIDTNGQAWSCHLPGNPGKLKFSAIWKQLKPYRNLYGYFMISLRPKEAKRRPFLLHRLIAMTFLNNYVEQVNFSKCLRRCRLILAFLCSSTKYLICEDSLKHNLSRLAC